MEREKDYLDQLIEEDMAASPEFAVMMRAELLMNDLVALRHQQGVSQQVLAERLGVSRPRVAQMEKNASNVGLHRFMAYAAALGATLEIVPPNAIIEPTEKDQGHPVRSSKAA